MVEERHVRRYGWRPSLPDPRDLRANLSAMPVARKVDPRDHLPHVFDQGDLGSCTANAVAAAIQYDRMLDGHPRTAAGSRLFIYYCERLLEGSLGQGDTGAFGRDGFKAARTFGVPTEHDWPYDVDNYADRPPAPVWAHAETHKLTKAYVAVPRSVTAMKQALTNQQTIAFGFSVFESFESSATAATGVVLMPEPGEAMLGGHEVLMVGYLPEEPDFVLCRNSWGKEWGIGGYFFMPWRYVLDPNLASDFRSIRRDPL